MSTITNPALRANDQMGTETGLKDSYILDVTRAWFGSDANYNNGESLMLFLHGNDVTPDGEGGEETCSLPIGKGWFTEDGGKTVRNEKGPQKKINKTSYYGIMIDRVVKPEPGFEKLLPAMQAANPAGVDSRNAAIWVGHRLQIDRCQVQFGIDKETKLPNIKERNLPTAYLGPAGTSAPAPAPLVSPAAPAPQSTVPAPGPSAPATSPAVVPASPAPATSGGGLKASLPVPVQAQLMILAKTKASDEFMLGALSCAEILASQPLQAAALNGQLLAEFLA